MYQGRSIVNLIKHPPKSLKAALVFSAVGLAALTLTSAATPTTVSEAEAGQLSASTGAIIGSDPQASGGKFVRFGSAVTPPPPPPPSGTSLLKPATSFTKHANLRYSDASPRLLLDLYTPDRSDRSSPLPLIVYIHGGSWLAGSKEECPPARDLGTGSFMQRGWAVACINYRLSGEAIYPAQIVDVKASIRWLRANAATYNLYSTKVGVWGGSAGGHLAALAGTSGDVKEYDTGANLQFSSRVAGVVDHFGPADLAHEDTTGVDPKGHAAILQLLGGPGPDLDARKRAASPVTYATPDDPPFHIVHGDRDRIVPISQSQILDQRLKQANVSSQLIVIPGAGHGGSQFFEPARIDAISRFLDLLVR